MKIGITFDLKSAGPAPTDLPDDFQEEFDSPQTIEAIARELRSLGHEVVELGDGRDFLQKVIANPPDLVFNFAEGTGVSRSREARVPAVLEMLGIPYTGSDPLTMAVTLDKACAKTLVAAAGVAVPQGYILPPDVPFERIPKDRLVFPLVAKPAWEGSSKGIRNKCLVHSIDQLADVVMTLRYDHHQPILLEEYIAGEELTVGVYGNAPPRVLGVLRVLPLQPTEGFIYSLEVKRNWRKLVTYESPPSLTREELAAVEQAALTAYETLGCRDVGRVDFRLRDGVPYFLEVNPLPGLNPSESDLVVLAQKVGWTYHRLIATIVEAALSRLGMN